MRQQLTAFCPTLERAASLTGRRGWVVLLSRYQRPKALRRNGVSRLTSVLTGLGLPPLESREAKVNAAKSQHTSRPDQTMIADLAKEVTRRNERIAEIATAIEA